MVGTNNINPQKAHTLPNISLKIFMRVANI